MDKFKFISTDNILKLPETAGVYCFKKGAKLLYIGKAINIKSRVRQHHDLINLSGQAGYIKTGSEIEALILEAKLIKKCQPKYNTVWRDDKNYFYVAATKEAFPQVFITHQPFVASASQGLRPIYKKGEGTKRNEVQTSFIGPFVDGGALKETLKILRKVFPYRTCQNLPKHACLWYQLKRCPAPCLSKSSLARQIVGFTKSNMRECQKNTANLMTTLKEGKNAVLKKLTKEMGILSKEQKFEQASRVRDQINSLEKIIAHASVLSQTKMKEVKPLSLRPLTCRRAEAYDIANIQGKEATGAMVVFTDGKPDKSQYRQFKIKGEQKPNDIAMLKEVLERRLKHREWPYPNLILIDGGTAQFNIAKKTCLKFGLNQTKIMAIAKKNNELYIEERKKPVLLKTLPRETFNLILQLRDEAHRFARRYHHQLRKKFLLK
ncbi:MAG: UvrB/UvrC motif-containing protein [Candidatus Nealsonbacteria bacterium]